MFRKKLFGSVAALAVGAGLLMSSGAGVASAATPLTGYAFDGNADLAVGGGSTTVYKIAQGFANLYDSTASCLTQNGVTTPQTVPLGQCNPVTQPYTGTNAGGNYDGDNISIAAPVGSSAGIADLNGDNGGTDETVPYEGAVNNQLNFALSSRAAKTTGGNCVGGNELTCDTFWGVAADGVQVFTWGSQVSGTTDSTSFAGTNGVTPTDLFNIWHCIDTTWGQLTNYTAAKNAGDSVPPSNAPIVPWAMNSSSGTYADFNGDVSTQSGNAGFTADDDAGEYLATNPGGSATSPTPATGKCARELTGNNPLPLENDIKPLLQDVQANQGGLNQNPMSTNNPANWIWFGSNGLLSAYTYLSQPSQFGNKYTTSFMSWNGTAPTAQTIGTNAYPAERILNLVTKSTDATCAPNAAHTACNFAGGPTNGNGTTDINVTGASGGPGGAVREFIRFVCRTAAESNFSSGGQAGAAPTDPYTGVSDVTEVGQTVSASGFTAIPVALRSSGSSCDVQTAF